MVDRLTGASLVEAVREVARIAGAVALRFYRTGVTVETKTDGSPVTIADREAESAARAWIERHFSGDGIRGEELGVTRADARRYWLLDPIDGTKTFIRGVPLWGSLVAVAEGESIIAGAAFFPALDEMIVAAPGEGASWNGEACRVSGTDRLDAATVLTSDERFSNDATQRKAWRALASRASVSRTWGDCYGYFLVATGRAEVMTDGAMSSWDAAAFLPIIEEAGGVFTDWTGRRTAFGGNAIATNAALAGEVRRILGGME